jgi:DNA-binding response OmpR family regulator
MNIPPRKILMIHGDKEERGKLAIMLTRFGHSVSFSDGTWKSEYSLDEYDLIIIDEYLPYGAGYVFLQNLSIELRAKTVYLSSGGILDRKLCEDSMSIYECVKKPVVPIDLAVVVCDFFITCLSKKENMAVIAT